MQIPIRKTLVEGVDEIAIERMWRHVEANRQVSRRSRRRSLALAALGAAAIVVGVVRLIGVGLPLHRGAGPLRLADGRSLPPITENDGHASPVQLDDGSNIALSTGVRLETIRNDGRAFVSRVAGGTAMFDVHPGGPRRWSIRCGESTVEVIGTRFDVECSGSRGRVRVERGVVHVHTAPTAAVARPDRQDEVSLVAGESIEMGGSASAEGAPVPSTAIGPAESAPGRAPIEPATSAPSVLRGPLPASDSAQRAAHVDPVADLLAIADRARLTGNATDAVKPLFRIVREHPSDPRAALASFMLGRVELDMLGNAVGAADAFDRAIALGLSRGLLEDAYVRLVEARARAGDAAGARKAAADYDSRFPGGEQSAAVSRWLGPH